MKNSSKGQRNSLKNCRCSENLLRRRKILSRRCSKRTTDIARSTSWATMTNSSSNSRLIWLKTIRKSKTYSCIWHPFRRRIRLWVSRILWTLQADLNYLARTLMCPAWSRPSEQPHRVTTCTSRIRNTRWTATNSWSLSCVLAKSNTQMPKRSSRKSSEWYRWPIERLGHSFTLPSTSWKKTCWNIMCRWTLATHKHSGKNTFTL